MDKKKEEQIIAQLTVISLDALRDHKPIAVQTAGMALDLFNSMAMRIAELEAALSKAQQNAAFFRSCALSGEVPARGAEPFPPQGDE